ncbi:hypothetical protein JR334_00455 [Clostridia bacterium]|nr:hypothetical protein JR334_00455 [Clostridia bacterium]
MKKNEHLTNILLGVGVIFAVSPLALYWFIHANPDRYLDIINKPYPFSHFGGGPFQFFMYSGLLVIGISFLVISMVLKRRKKDIEKV